MSLTDAVAFLGLGILVLGIFANRLSPKLARRRRALIIVGAAVLILGLGPSAFQGFRDGFREASQSDTMRP